METLFCCQSVWIWMWGRFTRRRPVLYLALAALGALAIVLALFLLPTHFGIPPPPLFHVSLNSSSAKGFLLTDRPDNSHPQYNLEKGERGSVEMIFVSETDQSLQLDVVATVGSDWEDPPLQPPGVTVSITPPILTLPPHGEAKAVLTLEPTDNAPGGEYYYHYGARTRRRGASYRTYVGTSSWFVITPYTPHRNFSIIDPSDFVAKGDVDIVWRVKAGTTNMESIILRSEGPSLSVKVKVGKRNLPPGANAALPPGYGDVVEVRAKSQGAVRVDITIPPLARSGAYECQLIMEAGNETHTADISLLVTPSTFGIIGWPSLLIASILVPSIIAWIWIRKKKHKTPAGHS